MRRRGECAKVYFEFRVLGPTAIKGLEAPVEVYKVVGAGPLKTHFKLAARRGLTKFVEARTRDGGDGRVRWSRPGRDTGRSLRRLARRARASRT